MEKKKSIVLGMTIAAVFLIAMVGSASADIEITTLPYTANQANTRYFLTGPLTSADTSTAGINIVANGITIDGQGNSITGSKASDACAATEYNPAVHSGVRIRDDSYDNAVIENLEIKNFCTGISLGWGGAWDVDNVTVTGCTIHDNGVSNAGTQGMYMFHTNDCNITKNDIYNNDGTGVPGGCSGGGNGIFMFGDLGTERGWYNEITWNKLYDNNKSGYFMKHMCMHNNISNNTAYGNVQGGVTLRCMMSSFNNITDNNASWNDGWGLEIGGYNNTIKRNRITNNTDQGIYLDRGGLPYGSHYNKIVDNNTIWDNNVGIHIVNGAMYNEISNNIECICYNQDNDIMNDESTTYGDYNTCDTTCGAHPFGGCTYSCPGSGPDLVVVDKHETWVGNDYTVTFTVKNIGNVAAGASDTRVWIDGNVQGTYPCEPLDPGETNTTTTGTINLGSAPDIIKVCADINNVVNEYGHGGENNNCIENVFGAPDLEISYFWWDEDGVVNPYGAGDGNVNDLWKTYYLVYRVKNVGDVAAAQFWMNLSCLDTSAVPVCTTNDGPVTGLGVGVETQNRVVGPFVIGCDNARPNVDWSQVCADCNDDITENYEHVPGQVQPQWDRCMPTYGGCCDECGDVNCEYGVNMGDYSAINSYVSSGSPPLTCKWAGDVDCEYGVNMGDYSAVNSYVSSGSPQLDCCDGGNS